MIGLTVGGIRGGRDDGFAVFEGDLAEVGGFLRIGAGFEVGLLEEIAPAGIAVLGVLTGLQVVESGLSGLESFGDFDDSAGLVGADVMPDDGVGGFGFFAGQRYSISPEQLESDWEVVPAGWLSLRARCDIESGRFRAASRSLLASLWAPW